jgi:hypothetical protein
MTRLVKRSHRLAPLALFVLVVAVLAACGPVKAPAPAPRSVPIMGQSSLTSEQIAGFFRANQPPGSPCLTVSIGQLTADFVWEGNVENVRGDVAFAQSIIETGWFR